MDGIEFVEQKCSKARFEACASQCRIARFLEGKTIFDGNCPCERPIECRFDFGKSFVDAAKDNFEQDDIDSGEAELLLFPDVKAYLRQIRQEFDIMEKLS